MRGDVRGDAAGAAPSAFLGREEFHAPSEPLHLALVGARVPPAPQPGAIDGEQARLKILRCEPAKGAGAPGDLLDEHLAIACGDGAIRILELQRAGKAPMKAADFLHGTPLKPPARLG